MATDLRSISTELGTVQTIEGLTNVFSNLASIQIRSMRREVLNAKLFFNDLWELYTQLRVQGGLHLLDTDQRLAIAITSPVGLGGGADREILSLLEAELKTHPLDIIVIGSHGVQLLDAAGLKTIGSYELPDISKEFTVEPLVAIVQRYAATSVFYQSYQSLGTQRAAKLELLAAPQELSADEAATLQSGQTTDVISPHNFIFEPSIGEVIQTLEDTMTNTTLTQLLLESRLSQLANRFTNMTLAHDRAKDLQRKLYLQQAAAKRARRDEATRQIMAAVGRR